MMDNRQQKIEWWTKIAGAGVAFVICAVLVVLSVQGVRQRRELAHQSISPEIQTIDPALIQYREVRSIQTGLHEARGIAVASDGSLYAAGDSSVILFDGAGKQNNIQSQDEAPACIAVAGDGSLLVGAQRSVNISAKYGKQIAHWTVPRKQAYLTSLAISGIDVWAADAGARVVYHYDRSGKLLGRIPGLVVPSPHLDVAAAKDGTVWVANPGRHRLEHYAKDGRLLSSWGKAGMGVERFSGCCNPTDFALLQDGRIVTTEKGLKRVKVYRADGAFDCVVAGPDAFSERDGALDVATDEQGQVYVLDRGDGTVHVFMKKTRADSEVRAPRNNDD